MVKEEKAIMSMQTCQLSYPATSLSRANTGHIEVQRSNRLGVNVKLALMELSECCSWNQEAWVQVLASQ